MNRILPECAEALEQHLKPALFKALCDPGRMVLLSRLATGAGPMNVSEASECCGVHVSGASRHLKMLEQAGVVIARRHGREVRYELNTGALVTTLRGLADAIEDCGRRSGCCGETPREENDDART
ncbi:MAG: ArsR/SmtB family transcription factor [Myxococcota bacterium]